MNSHPSENPSIESMIRSRAKDRLIYYALICSCTAVMLAVWSIITPPAGPPAAATSQSFEQPPTTQPLRAMDTIDDIAASKDKTDGIAASLAVLQHKIERLEQRTQRLEVTAEWELDNESTAVAPDDEIEAGLVELPDMDSAEDAASGVTTAVQQRFALEPIDSSAGYEVEDTVNRLFAEQDIVTTGLQHVDCYETGCWLEFDHVDGIADESFVEALLDSEIFAGEFYVETQTDDSGFARTVVVLARSGTELAVLP